MQRLPILLVNRDERFVLDPEHVIERRGCDLHVAGSPQEVGALLREQRFALGVVNGVSARLSPESLRALHGALRKHGLPIAVVVVARPDDAAGLRALALPDAHVLLPPLKHRYLLELTSRLIGVGTRRAATSVVQVFLEDEPRTRAIGRLENVSRHGLLARIDAELPPDGTPGAVSFVLPGSREQVDIHAVLTRRSAEFGQRRYGFAFEVLTPEAYERIAAYVG